MRIVSLASGSKGNCYFVEAGETRLLVDCGLALKVLEERLKQINVSPESIKAIIVSHEHNDHIKGLDVFFNKYHPQIYCNFLSAERIISLKPVLNGNISYLENDLVIIGELTINLISLSHDSVYCNGFRFNYKNASAAIITDLGYIDERIINVLKGSKVVYIESNHDEQMLVECKYPSILKARIKSNTGHLSNRQAGQAIAKLYAFGTKHFVLSHISENSNTYERAYITIANILSDNNIDVDNDVVIRFAHQYKIGNNFILGDE